MKQKIIHRICAVILCIATLIGVTVLSPISAYAKEQQSIYDIAVGIINWKKSTVGSTSDGYLINDTFLANAGTTPGDWYPIGLGRLGIADNQTGYLAVINENVWQRYQTAEKLDRTKATEWQWNLKIRTHIYEKSAGKYPGAFYMCGKDYSMPRGRALRPRSVSRVMLALI